jgi:hypothetical protein
MGFRPIFAFWMIAFIFNPIMPFGLDRAVWKVIDFLSAAIFSIYPLVTICQYLKSVEKGNWATVRHGLLYALGFLALFICSVLFVTILDLDPKSPPSRQVPSPPLTQEQKEEAMQKKLDAVHRRNLRNMRRIEDGNSFEFRHSP